MRLARMAAMGATMMAACFGVNAASGTAQAQLQNGSNLYYYVRPDGQVEQYWAAADGPLTKAFELMSPAWQSLAGPGIALTRGHLDAYLPIELKTMGHNAANEVERRVADYVFQQRSALNLVPFSYAWVDPVDSFNYGNMQIIRFPLHVAELLRWFPSSSGTASYHAAAKSIGTATQQYLYLPGPGVRPAADVSTGQSSPDWITATMSFGWSAEGMADLTKITGDSSFMDAADQKVDWIWSLRPNPSVDLLPEQLKGTGAHFQDGPGQMSDSDTLYYVRSLFAMWDKLRSVSSQAARATKYRNQALAVTNRWFEGGWMANSVDSCGTTSGEYGHFTRKMKFDGTAGQTKLYSDGKYNTLYVLIWAYKATGEMKYITRLKCAYDNLVSRSSYGRVGSIDDLFESGVGNGVLDSNEIVFVDILVEAYHATGDSSFLTRANALANVIYPEHSAAWGGSANDGRAGAIFLKLALALQPIWRLEHVLAANTTSLLIRQSSANGTVVFNRNDLFGKYNILYLPQGTYYVSNDGGANYQQVSLTTNKQIVF